MSTTPKPCSESTKSSSKMATGVALWVMTLTLACDLGVGENLQAWSQQAEVGVNHLMECSSTSDREPVLGSGDSCQWFRLGSASHIMSAGHIVITNNADGNTNCRMELAPVKEEDAGIYRCEVTNTTSGGNDTRGEVIKGLNIAGPLYASTIDKYETNVITAFITGAGVCFLVCACCFIDHFRYRTPEQKQKIESRMQERQAKQDRLTGVENVGLDTTYDAPLESGLDEKTQM